MQNLCFERTEIPRLWRFVPEEQKNIHLAVEFAEV